MTGCGAFCLPLHAPPEWFVATTADYQHDFFYRTLLEPFDIYRGVSFVTPVPEPGILPLALAALGADGVVSKRSCTPIQRSALRG
jgi:hypothetical protein